MKKLIMAASVMLAFPGLAAEPLEWKTATEAQYRAALAEILAQTNMSARYRVYSTTHFFNVVYRNDLAAFRAEADEALAGTELCNVLWQYTASWPKSAAAGCVAQGITTNLPYAIALAKRIGCNLLPTSFRNHGADADELAKVLGEFATWHTALSSVTQYKAGIQQAAAKSIKRRLREQGKSFVTKDGVNPVEQHLSALNAALNAPRVAGLNDWLASLGYKERIDLSRLPSDQEIAALKNDVMYGEKNMTENVKATLCICLGVDAYNAFVKEYNGDK